MAAPRRVRTMLHGDQRIEATELELLHTPALQRLYDLHQLGLTDRVFVDASHSRFQHVIGVMEQVDNILDAVSSNLDRQPNRSLEYRTAKGEIAEVTAAELANYVRLRRRAARLMGLLHDLTHAPFGHTLEDEIELQPEKHDEPQRQADAFYRLVCQYIGWLAIDNLGAQYSAPPLAAIGIGGANSADERLALLLDAPSLTAPPVDAEFIDGVARMVAPVLDRRREGSSPTRAAGADEVVQLFRDLRFAMRALLWLDALHKDKLDDLHPDEPNPAIRRDGNYPFEQLIDAVLRHLAEPPVTGLGAFHLQRDAFLLDVIGNTICADLLDYAERDSHFAGLKLDYDVNRIVENFTLVSHCRTRTPSKNTRDHGSLEPFLRTAISIFSHKLRIDVPGELMNLLQVRFYVYQRVLFHPTKCIAGAMLGSAIQLVGWRARDEKSQRDRPTLPLQYRFIGDAAFLHEVSEVARLLRNMLLSRVSVDAKNGLRPLSDFESEILFQLGALPETSLSRATRELVSSRRSESLNDVLADLHAAIRLLGRLAARRYHRPVFRLLPNVSIPGFGTNVTGVAAFFLNADTRAKAEREIEQRCGLPRGTVTIHCPNADGPRKIAEILILGERDGVEEAVPLREIQRIDDKIFAKHQKAIEAVEEMYASMWRLVVSVAPPFDERFAMLAPRIGRVLYAALRRQTYASAYGSRSEVELDGDAAVRAVPNDPTMLRELQAAWQRDEAGPPRVRLVYDDGRLEHRTESFVRVADEAIPRLETVSEEIRGLVRTGRWAAGVPIEAGLSEILGRVIVPAPAATEAVGNAAQVPLAESPPSRRKGAKPKQPDATLPDLLLQAENSDELPPSSEPPLAQ